MAMWCDQTCQRFEATAVGFETGFSLLRVRLSNWYAIAPHAPIGGSVSSVKIAAGTNTKFALTEIFFAKYELTMTKSSYGGSSYPNHDVTYVCLNLTWHYFRHDR